MTTYYVDGAVGDDANSGLAEGVGNAWATIQKAADTAWTPGDTIYIKNSVTYNELVLLKVRGDASNRILWEGYSVTPGDNGKVTIDGQSTRLNCVIDQIGQLQLWFAWKNFIFTNATQYGYNGNGASANTFINCEFTNNGLDGCYMSDGSSIYVNCVAANNGQNGIFGGGDNKAVGCIAYGNAGFQIGLGSADDIAYKCVAYGVTNDALDSGIRAEHILSCTVDGENQANANGIWCLNVNGMVGDNIAVNCNAGIKLSSNTWPQTLMDYNLLFNNTTNYEVNNSQLGVWYENDILAAPDFVDEAGDDYRVRKDSPAVGGGLKPGGIT